MRSVGGDLQTVSRRWRCHCWLALQTTRWLRTPSAERERLSNGKSGYVCRPEWPFETKGNRMAERKSDKDTARIEALKARIIALEDVCEHLLKARACRISERERAERRKAE